MSSNLNFYVGAYAIITAPLKTVNRKVRKCSDCGGEYPDITIKHCYRCGGLVIEAVEEKLHLQHLEELLGEEYIDRLIEVQEGVYTENDLVLIGNFRGRGDRLEIDEYEQSTNVISVFNIVNMLQAFKIEYSEELALLEKVTKVEISFGVLTYYR